jgi:membrane protein implicated in regulation of membrane protease activity
MSRAAMTYLYLFTFLLGGLILLVSLVLGGHGDADVDAGAEADGGADGHDGFADGGIGVVAALRSIRFWTFFAAFFGLTGLALGWVGVAAPVGAVAAAVVGLATGWGASAATRWLAADRSGAAAASGDYVGKTARVLVPVASQQTGKVRLELRGSTVDILATTDEESGFATGDSAIIVEVEGLVARIARLEAGRS